MPHRKVVSDQYVVCNLPAESKARQGSGREARKPPDRRLALADDCYHSNLRHYCFRIVAIWCGTSLWQAGGRWLPRRAGWKGWREPPCPTTRRPRPSAITRSAATSRRCPAVSRRASPATRADRARKACRGCWSTRSTRRWCDHRRTAPRDHQARGRRGSPRTAARPGRHSGDKVGAWTRIPAHVSRRERHRMLKCGMNDVTVSTVFGGWGIASRSRSGSRDAGC